MLFSTQNHHEFKFPLPVELYGDNPGIRHWRAFECVFHDYWFIVETLVAEGEDKMLFWKTICCGDLTSILSLVSQDSVKEHRINLVIPTYQTPNHQLQIKPIIEIFDDGEESTDGSKEFITSDGEHYIKSTTSEKELKGKRRIYLKRNIDVRSESIEA
jgi:hypothetical protein